MSVYLHQIATVVPDTAYQQDMIAKVMSAHLSDRRLARLTSRVYRDSSIEKRHSVIRDLVNPQGGLFFGEDGQFHRPGTGVRNDIYTKEAKQLFTCAAKKALAATAFSPKDITHVITVSCTGFFAPGPDYYVVKDLGLSASTGRYHIGFMGCYAAFPALKMAQAFCESNPDAVVLVVSLELCTLHLQPAEDIDSVIATSVFADGGAAAIISAKQPRNPRALKLEGFKTTITPQGEADMAWTIGDTGFNMVLSTYVPKILESNIASAVAPLLASAGVTQDEVSQWAVHPGGRAIVDKVQSGLALEDAQLAASRQVLRDYGNMSSATVLFVLDALMTEDAATDELIYAMAFGPGLTVESGLFRRA